MSIQQLPGNFALSLMEARRSKNLICLFALLEATRQNETFSETIAI
jgi:hypothetical protein